MSTRVVLLQDAHGLAQTVVLLMKLLVQVHLGVLSALQTARVLTTMKRLARVHQDVLYTPQIRVRLK